MIPVPGTIMPLPKTSEMLVISETAMRLRSTTVK